MSAEERNGASRPTGRARKARAGAVLAQLDEIEVDVERLVSGGDGFGRYQGIPIFIPRSTPGDRLLVRLTQRRPDYGRGEIVEVLRPGPGRREAPCPHYEVCGGCDLQHLEDDIQADLKAAATRETLERLGRIEIPEPVELVSGASWGYRLRTQLHSRAGERGVELGYHERGSHRLVPVQGCPVCRPELEAAMPVLAEALGENGPQRVDLACGEDGRVTSAPVVAGFPHGEVSVELAGIRLAFDARCFFQAHSSLLERLVEVVNGSFRGERLVDLYGGVGLFALTAASRYENVLVVEGDRIAARYARNNARTNRLKNVEVISRAVESWIGSLPEDVDRVIVDPPRAGLSAPVRATLAARAPRQLTYVSCHPATMARDLRQLTERYSVEAMAMLDLFPQTGHMEVVAQLKRRDAV